MWKNKVLFFFLITLISCGGNQKVADLSELTVGNQDFNDLIVNRVPDYGIDGGDGCVVMEEISMNITELDDHQIKGFIFNSKSKQPLVNAELNLFVFKNGLMDTTNIRSDENGIYESELNGRLKKIEVQYIAHRNLLVIFKNKDKTHNNI